MTTPVGSNCQEERSVIKKEETNWIYVKDRKPRPNVAVRLWSTQMGEVVGVLSENSWYLSAKLNSLIPGVTHWQPCSVPPTAVPKGKDEVIDALITNMSYKVNGVNETTLQNHQKLTNLENKLNGLVKNQDLVYDSLSEIVRNAIEDHEMDKKDEKQSWTESGLKALMEEVSPEAGEMRSNIKDFIDYIVEKRAAECYDKELKDIPE